MYALDKYETEATLINNQIFVILNIKDGSGMANLSKARFWKALTSASGKVECKTCKNYGLPIWPDRFAPKQCMLVYMGQIKSAGFNCGLQDFKHWEPKK